MRASPRPAEARLHSRPTAQCIRRSSFASPAVSCGRHRAVQTAAAAPEAATAGASGYQVPSQPLVDLLAQPVPPSYAFSRDRSTLLKLTRPPPHPPITDFMREELKLAGMRIDAEISARTRMSANLGAAVVDWSARPKGAFVSDLPEVRLEGVPDSMVLNYVRWNPDGSRFSFTLRSDGKPGSPPREPLALHTAAPGDMVARPVPGCARLNVIFEDYTWLDADVLVAATVPEGRGPRPEPPAAPVGPKISDNSTGKTSKARTYPDLLQSEYDGDLFEWLTTSELVSVNVATGETKAIGPPRMYTGVDPSPDGRFLLVSWIERPFSYELPVGRFPRVWQVWDREGKLVHEVCRLGLQDSIPIEFDATREGPRGINWRSDKGATLKWVEAQDGGDPKKNPDVSPRDIAYTLDIGAGVEGQEPLAIAQTDFRFGGIAWCDDDLALVYEGNWETRRSRVWTFRPADPGQPQKLLFDRNYEDIYTDPGSPLGVRHPQYATDVLARVDGGNKLLMQGQGASAKGNRPFIDVLDLNTKDTERVWQSDGPYYECPAGTIMNESPDSHHVSLDHLEMLFTRETPEDNPQFFIRTFTQSTVVWPNEACKALQGGKESELDRISDEPHPYVNLKDLQRELLQYKRADGVGLTAELFTPPGYDAERDGRLPCVLWAYPREYKSKDAAGQLDKSPFEFSSLGASSPLVWLAKGYAVLSGPSMPIVAEGDEEPNDTYVRQLVASAEAAIEEVVRRGVVDPARVATGGHSYGAFMTANLLAHAGHLFACGVAQSGAYNRTLTPFGFQAEQRSFWDAPDTYAAMAPFNNAHKIDTPLLLIHGEADNNTGTFPLQSERMYSAVKGHGCKARLVVLPFESHGYRAYESIMHVLAEKEKWLEEHCPPGPRLDADAGGEAQHGEKEASQEPEAAGVA